MVPAAKFEDHCWKDVISAEDMELYSNYARDTFVGPRAAVVAIDLYNLVYSGGARPPYELQKDHPNSCGIYAHQAIEPTQALLAAARRAGLPIFFATKDVADHNRPAHAISTKRKQHPVAAEDYDIHDAFEVHAEDVIIRKQREHIPRHTTALAREPARHRQPDRLWRSDVRLRAGKRGRCIFRRPACEHRGGMHIRPCAPYPQGEPVRHASQICGRDASGGCARPSRCA
jgi:hypothetical protein